MPFVNGNGKALTGFVFVVHDDNNGDIVIMGDI